MSRSSHFGSFSNLTLCVLPISSLTLLLNDLSIRTGRAQERGVREFGLDDHHYLAPHLRREKQRRETDVDSQALIELVFFTQSTPVFFTLCIMKSLSPLLLLDCSLGQCFSTGFASGLKSYIRHSNQKCAYNQTNLFTLA